MPPSSDQLHKRELISERTVAGGPFTMTPAKVRAAMAAMGNPETNVGELCDELGISRQTLYRHVSPTGEVRADGTGVLNRQVATARARRIP
jgi:DNA-binding transcriptional ArsR family regulator